VCQKNRKIFRQKPCNRGWGWYDARMNFTTDPQILADLKRRNAAAKKAIQAKRSKDAKILADMRDISHDHFPTYYKYG
jgi:hypothetical protein